MERIVGRPPYTWDDAEKAACRQADPELFFPKNKSRLRQAKALEFCNGNPAMGVAPCPLRIKCWKWAIYANELGIWGGKTEKERKEYLSTYGKIIL